MPWKTSSLEQARQRFIQAALRGVSPVAQLCREAGISRKTGFKWLARFRQAGRPGLRNRSRQPRRSPGRTPARWLQLIGQVRRRHPHWGGKKIYACLRRQHPRARLPKSRTITRWLQRMGLVARRVRRARRGPQLPRPPLTQPKRPNEVWTIDFKGSFRTRDGRRVEPLTVRDLHSRFILGIRLLARHLTAVKQYLSLLFRRYGLPKVIRVDHGTPFAGDGTLDLSRLSVWWLRLGIQVEFTRRARPQDNGAHEQMHRVYKAELNHPPAQTPRAQQWRTTRWVNYYNHYRPHEALGQKVPAVFYRKSRRRYRRSFPPISYPAPWPQMHVTLCGYIRWQNRLRVIGRAFGGQLIGLKAIKPDTHEVYFDRLLIGILVDHDAGGLRPVQYSNAAVPSSKA